MSLAGNVVFPVIFIFFNIAHNSLFGLANQFEQPHLQVLYYFEHSSELPHVSLKVLLARGFGLNSLKHAIATWSYLSYLISDGFYPGCILDYLLVVGMDVLSFAAIAHEGVALAIDFGAEVYGWTEVVFAELVNWLGDEVESLSN